MERGRAGCCLVDSGCCRLCRAPDASVGHHAWPCGTATVAHQTFVWSDRRPRSIIKEGASAVDAHPLWGHALPPRILPPCCRVEQWFGQVPSGYQGEIYGDGAAWDVNDDRVHLASFAVGALPGTDGSEDLGDVAAAWHVRATVGGWFPSSFRAELLAIATAIEAASPPFAYVGDCLSPLAAIWADKCHAMASSRSFHADVWARIAFALDDRGSGGRDLAATFVKVKAHRSRCCAAAAANAKQSQLLRHWLGNVFVDREAKAGAAVIDRRDDLAAVERADHHARKALVGIAVGVAAWFELVPRHKPKRSKVVARSLADVAQHDLRRTGRGRWACRCCGVVAHGTAVRRALRCGRAFARGLLLGLQVGK